jgi:predicted enzyme related to lactoylglutathione lyase
VRGCDERGAKEDSGYDRDMAAMKLRPCLICAFVLLLAALRVHAEDDGIQRFGLYVVVSDLDRAATFYEKVFQKKPYVRNDRFIGFEVAGGLYGIFAESSYAQKLVRGNSAVPYIRVKDIEQEFERIKALGARMVHDKIVQEGPLQLFMFADPDGNRVEFFAVAAPPPG